MAPSWGKKMGSIASDGQENCCMMGERMQIENLFFNNFVKVVNFLWNFYQLDENSRCLGIV
jgi:hypothetical protein